MVSKTEIEQRKRLSDRQIKDKIRKVIISKLPKEKKRNTMSVVRKPISFLWRPNNYRLKITIKKGLNTTLKTSVKKVNIKRCNYGSKMILKNFYGTTIMMDKESLTVIYNQRDKKGKKKWYNVTTDSISSMDEYVDNKVKSIEIKCIENAMRFVSMFKGVKIFPDKRIWIRQEDAVKGEEFIDSIPDNLIIHDTYFKKVYDRDLEFKSPTYMKDFIANRTIERLTPEIADRLEKIEDKIEKLSFTRFIEEEEAHEVKKNHKPSYVG